MAASTPSSRPTLLTTFTLTDDVRVRTNGEPAMIVNPFADGPSVLDGDAYRGKWLTLVAGTKFQVVSYITKPDAYFIATHTDIHVLDEDTGDLVYINGRPVLDEPIVELIVLRDASWTKLHKHSCRVVDTEADATNLAAK